MVWHLIKFTICLLITICMQFVQQKFKSHQYFKHIVMRLYGHNASALLESSCQCQVELTAILTVEQSEFIRAAVALGKRNESVKTILLLSIVKLPANNYLNYIKALKWLEQCIPLSTASNTQNSTRLRKLSLQDLLQVRHVSRNYTTHTSV